MNYKEITAKLIAVRKEIRLNVWHLKIADEFAAENEKRWERMLWGGDSTYVYKGKKYAGGVERFFITDL